MKIYKLTDDCSEKPKTLLIVTDLKQGVKNPNRVNVYINDKYEFSLDVAQIVDYKLKKGLEIDALRLEELRKASIFGKLYQRTLEWVLARPRSEKEVRDYLRQKLQKSSSDMLHLHPSSRSSVVTPVSVDAPMSSEDLSEFSQSIIDRLVSKGYIDDRKFAEFWVEHRFVNKGVSRKRLAQELMKKGVSHKIIDAALGERNEEEELRKVIAKKRQKYDDEKLMAYLVRQGFSYDLVRKEVLKEDY